MERGMKKLEKGFTFIEMVVVLTVMAIVFGAGYANYSDYTQRKIVQKVTNEVFDDVRLAREYAITSKKICASNEELRGVRFSRSDPKNYSIDADCSGNFRNLKSVGLEANEPGINQMLELDDCSNSSTVYFRTLGEGVDIDSSGCVQMLVSTDDNKYVVGVAQTGTVSVEKSKAVCGDGTVDIGETCEGGYMNCETLLGTNFHGYAACSSTYCTYDTSACYECGDYNLDPGEECDQPKVKIPCPGGGKGFMMCQDCKMIDKCP
jgi:prepilin-type N-terminal cleavage/methylation domain-containing protein